MCVESGPGVRGHTRLRAVLAVSSVLAGSLLAGCAPDREPEPAPPPGDGEPAAATFEVPTEALERGRAAADALGASLQARLFTALEEGGPMQAVEVCSVEAQAISQEFSDETLLVRRVSLLTRNPLNDPDDYEEGRLRAMAAAHAAGQELSEGSEVVVEDGVPTLRILRPILVAPPCLQCHGDPGSIDGAVLERIRERYPRDRAVGYEAGDLRGAISVRVRLEQE